MQSVQKMAVAPYGIIREVLFKIMSQVLGTQISELSLMADYLNYTLEMLKEIGHKEEEISLTCFIADVHFQIITKDCQDSAAPTVPLCCKCYTIIAPIRHFRSCLNGRVYSDCKI